MRVVSCISGGPDSFSYALLWSKRGHEINPILFNYGQKANKEIQIARWLCTTVGFEKPITIDMRPLRSIWRGTQLTDDAIDVAKQYETTVVVPIRNIVFLSIATAYAYAINAQIVTYGAHLDDCKLTEDNEPLYPDCTPSVAMLFEGVVNLAHFPTAKKKIEIWSPAREKLTKSDIIKQAYEEVRDLLFRTWSCYKNEKLHCGQCESCINRHNAFMKALGFDKTKYLNPIWEVR
jgi:7-cyano-7-deazaguanine synthase